MTMSSVTLQKRKQNKNSHFRNFNFDRRMRIETIVLLFTLQQNILVSKTPTGDSYKVSGVIGKVNLVIWLVYCVVCGCGSSYFSEVKFRYSKHFVVTTDFGDTCYSYYVFELAIAMAYMMIQSKELSTGGLVIAGYGMIRNIPDHERKVLKVCMKAVS